MQKSLRPRLVVETIGDVSVVGFTETELVSEGTVREIAESLCDLAEVQGSGKFLFNFRNVQSMSGRMLAVLLLVARKIDDSEGGIKLCGITPQLLARFEITRLHHHFEIYREQASALRAFSRPRLSLCTV